MWPVLGKADYKNFNYIEVKNLEQLIFMMDIWLDDYEINFIIICLHSGVSNFFIVFLASPTIIDRHFSITTTQSSHNNTKNSLLS